MGRLSHASAGMSVRLQYSDYAHSLNSIISLISLLSRHSLPPNLYGCAVHPRALSARQRICMLAVCAVITPRSAADHINMFPRTRMETPIQQKSQQHAIGDHKSPQLHQIAMQNMRKYPCSRDHYCQ